MIKKAELPCEVAEAIEKMKNADITGFGIIAAAYKPIDFEVIRMAVDEEAKILNDFTKRGNEDVLLHALLNGFIVREEAKI